MTACAFCTTFDANAVEITGVGVGTDPDELREAFTKLGPALDDLDAQAPAEIKAETEALTVHLRSYTSVLDTYGWSYERIASEGSAEDQAAVSGGGDVIPAFDTVVSYVKERCPGITLPG